MGNSQPSPGSAENPWQEKPKQNHTETHSNQTDKIKDKDKILKVTKVKRQKTYKGNLIKLSANFSAENLQPGMQ